MNFTVATFTGAPVASQEIVVHRNCHKDRTMNEVYEATERKAAMLRQAG